MSKFALTGVLLCILVGFFHYNPKTKSTEPTTEVSTKSETESLFFPISEQIKLARLEKHLSQKDLGDRVGLSKANMEKIEKGQVVPTHDMLYKLQRELKVRFTLEGN